MITPGMEIVISDEKKRLLAGVANEMIDDLEADYSKYFTNIGIWWRNYEAISRQTTKNFPFRNASNVVVPLIQAQVNGAVADDWNTLFAADPRVWTVTTEDQENETMAKNIARHVNWQAMGNDFDLKPQAYSNFLEKNVIGCSVFALNWRRDERWLYTRSRKKGLKPQLVRFANGPLLESVPRESILWDTQHMAYEAPFIVREFSMSYEQIVAAAYGDVKKTWDMQAIDDISGQGGAVGPSENVRTEKDRHDDKRRWTKRRNSDHDVREIRVDWPILNAMGINGKDLATPFDFKPGTPHVPIVITMHRKMRKILRLIAEPYHLPHKPFFDIYYQRRAGRGAGVGLSKKLEGMQAGITTVYNQQIDAQTRANSVWAKTNDPKLMDAPIDPSSPIYDPSMNSFEPLRLNDPSFSNMQLIAQTYGFTERLTGQSDPSFGKDTTAGGHPTPATSTQLLLGQSKRLSSPSRDMIAHTYGMIGQSIAMLDQQFETDMVKLHMIHGERDAESISEFLFPEEPIPSSYLFRVTGLSRTMNPDAAMKQAIMVSQMNQNYWSGNLKAAEALAMLGQAPLDPAVKEQLSLSYIQFIQSNTESHTDFLEAADVDDVERFVLDLERSESRASQLLRDFAGRARELATAGGGAPQPGMAANQSVPAQSARGAFRAGGGLPPLAGVA